MCYFYLQLHRTPLHIASEHGHSDIVSVLLHHRANIEAQDKVRNEHCQKWIED